MSPNLTADSYSTMIFPKWEDPTWLWYPQLPALLKVNDHDCPGWADAHWSNEVLAMSGQCSCKEVPLYTVWLGCMAEPTHIPEELSFLKTTVSPVFMVIVDGVKPLLVYITSWVTGGRGSCGTSPVASTGSCGA